MGSLNVLSGAPIYKIDQIQGFLNGATTEFAQGEHVDMLVKGFAPSANWAPDAPLANETWLRGTKYTEDGKTYLKVTTRAPLVVNGVYQKSSRNLTYVYEYKSKQLAGKLIDIRDEAGKSIGSVGQTESTKEKYKYTLVRDENGDPSHVIFEGVMYKLEAASYDFKDREFKSEDEAKKFVADIANKTGLKINSIDDLNGLIKTGALGQSLVAMWQAHQITSPVASAIMKRMNASKESKPLSLKEIRSILTADFQAPKRMAESKERMISAVVSEQAETPDLRHEKLKLRLDLSINDEGKVSLKEARVANEAPLLLINGSFRKGDLVTIKLDQNKQRTIDVFGRRASVIAGRIYTAEKNGTKEGKAKVRTIQIEHGKFAENVLKGIVEEKDGDELIKLLGSTNKNALDPQKRTKGFIDEKTGTITPDFFNLEKSSDMGLAGTKFEKYQEKIFQTLRQGKITAHRWTGWENRPKDGSREIFEITDSPKKLKDLGYNYINYATGEVGWQETDWKGKKTRQARGILFDDRVYLSENGSYFMGEDDPLKQKLVELGVKFVSEQGTGRVKISSKKLEEAFKADYKELVEEKELYHRVITTAGVNLNLVKELVEKMRQHRGDQAEISIVALDKDNNVIEENVTEAKGAARFGIQIVVKKEGKDTFLGKQIDFVQRAFGGVIKKEALLKAGIDPKEIEQVWQALQDKKIIKTDGVIDPDEFAKYKIDTMKIAADNAQNEMIFNALDQSLGKKVIINPGFDEEGTAAQSREDSFQLGSGLGMSIITGTINPNEGGVFLHEMVHEYFKKLVREGKAGAVHQVNVINHKDTTNFGHTAETIYNDRFSVEEAIAHYVEIHGIQFDSKGIPILPPDMRDLMGEELIGFLSKAKASLPPEIFKGKKQFMQEAYDSGDTDEAQSQANTIAVLYDRMTDFAHRSAFNYAAALPHIKDALEKARKGLPSGILFHDRKMAIVSFKTPNEDGTIEHHIPEDKRGNEIAALEWLADVFEKSQKLFEKNARRASLERLVVQKAPFSKAAWDKMEDLLEKGMNADSDFNWDNLKKLQEVAGKEDGEYRIDDKSIRQALNIFNHITTIKNNEIKGSVFNKERAQERIDQEYYQQLSTSPEKAITGRNGSNGRISVMN